MYFNPKEIVGERYRIVRPLGQGGFGTTYLAEDTQYDAADSVTDYSAFEVVLKQIKLSPADDDLDNRDTGYLSKLELEANILKRLSLEYVYIPKCFSSFYEGNYYYIVQEYIKGLDLTHEIQPGIKLAETEAVDILDKILSILFYVHQNNIIHRDIKPANIIRRESNNQLVLIDFGVVKEIATKHTGDRGQQRTRMIYTKGYTPLEQFDGNPQLNSDIYALGMIIMRSVTGFSTEAICDPLKIPKKDSEGNYNWSEHAPQISPKLKVIISQMIKSRFRDRYQSVDEIIRDLARLKETKNSINNNSFVSIDDRQANSDRNTSNPQNFSVTAVKAELISTPIDSQSNGERGDSNNKHNYSEEFSSDNNVANATVTKAEPTLIDSRKSKANFLNYKKIRFISIILISCLAAITVSIWGIPFASNLIGNENVCSLDLDDRLSCGEEILDPSAKSAVRANGAEMYEQKKYADAFKYFQKSWQKNRDAETLIYLNNALLDANQIKAKTISVAVPFSSDEDEAKEIKSSAISQDFLRGVAQAQTEVNLSLSKSSLEIAKGLEQYKFLPHRAIAQNSDRGLKVIIADDGNQKQQAEEIAIKLTENKHNLGVIGHYTSKMTQDTVDIYQQNSLAQISYGTTTKELSEGQKSNFFRVVYTTQEEAEALVSYIDQYDLEAKQIAIFYNPSSDYSFDFKDSIEQKIAELNNPNINIVETFDLADDRNFVTSLAMNKLDDRGINICLLLPDGQISNSLARAIEVIEADNGQRLMLGGNPLINPQVSKIQTEQSPNLIVSTFWHPTADRQSSFQQQSKKLWDENVDGGATMAYDATLAMIEAIREQPMPSRKGTIEQLRKEDFAVAKAATGTIVFNTPKNGDRLDFYPTLVRLHQCESGQPEFVSLSLDDLQASDLVCQTDRT